MTLVFCDGGLLAKLQSELSTFNTYKLHLYSNNKTPAAGDTASAYTECTFSGYAAQNIVGFTTPVTVVSGLARTLDVQHDFVWDHTGSPGDIYGYYVTDGSGNLQWAERYASAPFVISVSQDTFSVIPRMDAQSIP